MTDRSPPHEENRCVARRSVRRFPMELDSTGNGAHGSDAPRESQAAVLLLTVVDGGGELVFRVLRTADALPALPPTAQRATATLLPLAAFDEEAALVLGLLADGGWFSLAEACALVSHM